MASPILLEPTSMPRILGGRPARGGIGLVKRHLAIICRIHFLLLGYDTPMAIDEAEIDDGPADAPAVAVHAAQAAEAALGVSPQLESPPFWAFATGENWCWR